MVRLVYHNLFLKNSSLNYINRCGPKYRPPSYDSSFGQLVTALVVEDQGILQSPGSSSGAEKKKKDKKTTSEKRKSSKSSDKPSKSVETRPSRSSADDRIDELDKKWADRFNRLEANHRSTSL